AWILDIEHDHVRSSTALGDCGGNRLKLRFSSSAKDHFGSVPPDRPSQSRANSAGCSGDQGGSVDRIWHGIDRNTARTGQLRFVRGREASGSCPRGPARAEGSLSSPAPCVLARRHTTNRPPGWLAPCRGSAVAPRRERAPILR